MQHGPSHPSPWVVRHADRIPRDDGHRVLDLACGGGRHSRHLHALGHAVLAVDVDVGGVADLAGTPGFEARQTDLETARGWPLGAERYAGVVVTNYLWRPILADIVAAVAPGGVLIYETFAVGNEAFGKPSNPDHLLRPGELLDAVRGALEVAAYEHGPVSEPRPAVVQRICALRPDA